MFRITRDPSSGRFIQCLAKITVMVLSCRLIWTQSVLWQHIVCNCCWFGRVYCCSLVCVVILCVFVVLCVYCCSFTLDTGLLARSQYSEGPSTGHLGTGFSWFPCIYKQMLRWFQRFQVATTCFSCSPPDLNSVVTDFMFCLHVK